jgi:FixJ family two-component response regulator
MSGFELYRRLAVSSGEMPVVFITACDDAATRDEAEKLAGAGSYLAKPFMGDELLDSVTRALGRR